VNHDDADHSPRTGDFTLSGSPDELPDPERDDRDDRG
jgi:hypothetical protein